MPLLKVALGPIFQNRVDACGIISACHPELVPVRGKNNSASELLARAFDGKALLVEQVLDLQDGSICARVASISFP